MKKLYMIFLLLGTADVFGQYCTPTCAIYASTMPGITNFTLNTINRTSADCESGCPVGGSNFVSTTVTQQTTNLTRGQTYNISMTFTVDAPISPDMNLRVYIDYNKNFQLDDPGEVVLTVNNKLPGTHSAAITIPTNAALGATRLRALAKMTSNGGHSLPTPCNNPPDPLDFHGEIEDYTVNILSATGLASLPAQVPYFDVLPSEAGEGIQVVYGLNKPSVVTMLVFDLTGKLSLTLCDKLHQPAGQYQTETVQNIAPGVYFIRMEVEGQAVVRKVALTR